MRTAAARARRESARPAEIEEATIRYLVYGLIPAWVVPAAADWLLHRLHQDPGQRLAPASPRFISR